MTDNITCPMCGTDTGFGFSEEEELRSEVTRLQGELEELQDDAARKAEVWMKRANGAAAAADQLRAEITRLQSAGLDALSTAHALVGAVIGMHQWFKLAQVDGSEVDRAEREARKLADEVLARWGAEDERLRPMFAPTESAGAGSEITRLRAEIEELQAKYDRACDALQPFAEKYLYPDDCDPSIREDEDWDEAKNDEEFEDLFIKRAWIRRAREVVKEAKS